MRRGGRPLALIAVWLSVGAAHAAVTGVGQFTKRAGTGTQVIPHDLGVTPTALLFWSAGRTDATLGAAAGTMFAITDGTTSRSVAMSSTDNVATSNRSRVLSTDAITFVLPGELLRARAVLASWSPTDFTIDWQLNDGTGDLIQFLAIGGTDVRAKVIDWTLPTSLGAIGIGGTTFLPDTAFHVHAGTDYTAALDTPVPGASLGVAMDATNSQWCYASEALDASTTGGLGSIHRTNCMCAASVASGLRYEGACTSFQTTGFTLSTSVASPTPGRVASLMLSGFRGYAADFARAVTPSTQTLTTGTVNPSLVIVASRSYPGVSLEVDCPITWGAATPSTQVSLGAIDVRRLSVFYSTSVMKTGVVTQAVGSNSTLQAQARVSRFGTGAFDLQWLQASNTGDVFSFTALAPTQACGTCLPAPTALAFTTPSRAFVAGACGGAAQRITVELRDATSAPALAKAGGQGFTLSSTSPGTVSWFSDSACTTQVAGDAFVIPVGRSSVDIYYRDTAAGSPSISLTNASGLTNPTAQVHAVAPAPASSLFFITPARSFTAGACGGLAQVLTVEVRDAFGNPSAVMSPRALQTRSSSSAGTFFLDQSCATPAPGGVLTLPSGQLRSNLFYSDTLAGTPSLGFSSASGLSLPADQIHTVSPGPRTQLVFTTPARTTGLGVCSQALSVRGLDAFGNGAPVAMATAVSLSSTSTTTRFYSDPGCTSQVAIASLASGMDTATFYASDTVEGSPVLTAQLAPLPSVSQVLTVLPNTRLIDVALAEGRCGEALAFRGGQLPTVIGTGPFTYAAEAVPGGTLPDGFAVDPSTGAPQWTPPLRPFAQQPFVLRVTSVTGTDTRETTFEVACDQLALHVACGSAAGADTGWLFISALLLHWAGRRRLRRALFGSARR